ncbi:MAG: NAD-dependent epimerase/dehydratase family protein [Coriobacteriia bacterium]|nr:NAD-dependent epimerase/dehydratase family protein [Coriobacteriia bacterium]
MKILITGGAGFIGSNLAHYLLALEGEIMVIDDLSSGYAVNIDPRSGFRKLSILDDAFVDACVEFAPDVIVHFAAQSSVTLGEAQPGFTHEVNIEGTRRVIEAAKACNVERLVFASSAAVYGVPKELPLVENMLLEPINVYGETKLAGEELIRTELDGGDIDYALLRFSNVYGPRQTAEGEGGVVSCFCEELIAGRLPIIYGDGQQIRDFIYVADVVQAVTWAIGGDIMFREAGGPASASVSDDRGVFNISTGYATTIEQLLNGLRVPANFSQKAKYAPERSGDIRESILSPRKALDTFEWSAEIDLNQGLDTTWTWYWRQKH